SRRHHAPFRKRRNACARGVIYRADRRRPGIETVLEPSNGQRYYLDTASRLALYPVEMPSLRGNLDYISGAEIGEARLRDAGKEREVERTALVETLEFKRRVAGPRRIDRQRQLTLGRLGPARVRRGEKRYQCKKRNE